MAAPNNGGEDVEALNQNLGLLNQVVGALYSAEKYPEALQMATRALEVTEKKFGKNAPTTALSAVATIDVKLGDFANAEALHRRALAIREARLGYGAEDECVA